MKEEKSEKQSLDIKCLLCGKCCHLIIDGKQSKIPCKHLVRLKSGKTLCRVYKTRLNRDIGHENRCYMRKDSPWNYPGCPFNILDPKKPMAGEEDGKRD